MKSKPLSWLTLSLFSALFSLSLKAQVCIDKATYTKQLEGFWLGQSIANWTGLITEMDKIGTPETHPFYTDDDWGKADQQAFWGEYVPHSSVIDFYLGSSDEPWGADDDTDIEYMYLHLYEQHKASILTPEQIRDGWLKHIYSETDAPLYKKFPDSTAIKENFLWVSNERARLLMEQGMLPPNTGMPANNPSYNMIDAQLSTEIFGLFAPGQVDLALRLADLPIRTTASGEAKSIAQFYVVMHALAPLVDKSQPIAKQVMWLADQASQQLPPEQFPSKMYQFVKQHYIDNADKTKWESTRDAIYQRYQLSHHDGYQYAEPFDAGINFAASLVSLFYGQGDFKNTLRIGTLVGWDADNPTATWGGLLGFMIGKHGIEKAFSKTSFSSDYWIHRTRRNFPDHTPTRLGEDNFTLMAERMIRVSDRIQGKESNTNGSISLSDLTQTSWCYKVGVETYTNP